VRHGWFADQPNQPSASNTSSTPVTSKDEPLSPKQKDQPPIPVIANWFNKLEEVINKENEKDRDTNPTESSENKNDEQIEKVMIETNSCELATKDMLNEMFDSLVNEYNTMEILEGGGETETMKRKKSDNKTAESELLEEQISETKEVKQETSHNEVKQDIEQIDIIPPTPQTPKEIRKLFQEPANFNKEIVKCDDLTEFREGVKGKVKESRESFLKQSASESVYQQEKQDRKSELLQLINRPGQLESDNEAAKKDLLMREERNKELEMLCKRKPDTVADSNDKLQELKNERNQELSLLSQRKIDYDNYHKEDKTQVLKDERKKELEEIANRKVEIEWTCDTKEKMIKEERARELYNIANRKEEKAQETELKQDDILRQERAEELRQISTFRSQSSSDFDESKVEQTSERQTMDDDLRGKVRNTAAAWKEREKSGSRDKINDEGIRELPSRRIGSLLKNDPDYWSLDEPEEQDLPAPPPELSEIVDTNPNPPPGPPPRQSSRGKLEEYTRDPGWSAPWRKS